MNNLDTVSRALREGKRAIICGHSMPDGDSIGSVLAMYFLLKGVGLECYMATVDPIPEMYNFLPEVENFRSIGQLPEDVDLAVVLDCTDLNRLGEELGSYISKISRVVNIDHHISNQEFGTFNYVDSNASATGEIVFELVKLMDIPLEQRIAVGLYTAIVMDTGSFRFDNTTDVTHEIAAELFRTGIDIPEINKSLFENKDPVHLQVLGYALSKLRMAANGRIAWVTIPTGVMQELGARDEHVDGVINYPRMISGVEIGLLFREISPDKFKIGFRSKKYIDVNKLAAKFGGGGHPRASGCTVEGTMQSVEERVVNACVQALEEPVKS